MRVNITLYKTNFDEENPFVSNSKAQRVVDIETKFNENKLLMENASFNIETPFRIARNFFDLDKKYNYAKYEYYNGNELKDTRFYFIRNFKYISDNVTDMVVAEDVVGEHFWDLDIKYCMPQRYTYKDFSLRDRVYSSESELSKTFKKVYEFDNSSKSYVQSGGKWVKVGFIVVSAITNNDEQIYCKYIEDGVPYNINTYLIPFFFDDDGLIDIKCTSILWGNKGFTYDNMINIDEFQKISRISTNGFKYVSSFIFMETDNIVKGLNGSSTTGNVQIVFNDKCIKDINLDGFEGETIDGVLVPSMYLIKINKFETGLFDFKITNNVKKTVSNCSKLLFSVDGEYTGIDISMCGNLNFYEDTIKFSVSQSLVPPYSVSLNYNSNKTNKEHVEIQRNSTFMYIDDSYTEWLKSNRNSAITGLATRQNYEAFINERKAFTNFGKGIINTVVGANKTYSGGGGAQALLELTGGTLTSLMDYVASVETTDKNHEKERALFDLQIQDLINTPDNITMGNNVFFHYANKKYIKITYMENVRIKEIMKINDMYGVSNAEAINTIRSHRVFDYIRTNTLTLSFMNDFNPNEAERIAIENYFSSGIRVWYNLNEYKNFETHNDEEF